MLTQKTILNFITVALLISVLSCSGDNGGAEPVPTPDPITSINLNETELQMNVYDTEMLMVTTAIGESTVTWKNGTQTDLTDGTSFARAQSIFVFGFDVFVAGTGPTGATALLNAVTFWVLNYVNLFTNNLKDNKNVSKLLLGAVGMGF